MKYIAPSEKVVKQLPSEQLLKNYGRSSKLLLAEKDIPDLHFDITDRKEKGNSSEKTEVMEIMDVNTGVMTPQNSDFREHSRNSLISAVGEAQERVSEQRSVKQVLDPELHSNASEYREHSQNSRIKHVGMVEVTVGDQVTECPAANSDFPEDSQNLLSSGKRERDNGEPNVSFGDSHGRCLVMASEFRELSPNLRVVTEGSGGAQKKHHTRPVCSGEPSEYSRDSLGACNNVSVPSFSWFKSMSQIVGLTATWQDKVEGNPTGAGTWTVPKYRSNSVYTSSYKRHRTVQYEASLSQ